MKKALASYVIILIGAFVLFSVLGSQGDYAIEQKAWKIHKQYLDILKDPSVIPDKTFDQVITGYKKIIERYPQSKMTPRLHFLIGRVHFLKKDYEAARRKFREIITIYPDKPEIQAEALGAVAATYEAQENWPQAKKTYDDIVLKYPLTRAGLGVPIYIANYYKNKNDYRQAMDSYEKAIRQYQLIAREHPDSHLEYSALHYLSNCYLVQKRWSEAVQILGKILQKYGKPEYMNIKTADTVIKTINVVCAYQLKDYGAATKIYQDIIDRDPGHSLKAYLQKTIEAFNKLKEKGVQVSPVQ
jgi:tetratricopeptide (TPR) repeat protein